MNDNNKPTGWGQNKNVPDSWGKGSSASPWGQTQSIPDSWVNNADSQRLPKQKPTASNETTPLISQETKEQLGAVIKNTSDIAQTTADNAKALFSDLKDKSSSYVNNKPAEIEENRVVKETPLTANESSYDETDIIYNSDAIADENYNSEPNDISSTIEYEEVPEQILNENNAISEFAVPEGEYSQTAELQEVQSEYQQPEPHQAEPQQPVYEQPEYQQPIYQQTKQFQHPYQEPEYNQPIFHQPINQEAAQSMQSFDLGYKEHRRTNILMIIIAVLILILGVFIGLFVLRKNDSKESDNQEDSMDNTNPSTTTIIASEDGDTTILSTIATTSESETSSYETITEESNDSNIKIIDNSVKEVYYNGDIFYTFESTVPQLKYGQDSYAEIENKLNTVFLNIQNKANLTLDPNSGYYGYSKVDAEVKERFENESTDANKDIKLHSTYLGYEVLQMNEKYISIGISNSGYFGGAHGTSNTNYYFIDITNGDILSLTDLFTSNDEFRHYVADYFYSSYYSNYSALSYWDKEKLYEYIDPKAGANWFIKNGDLCVLYNRVGIYAEGIQTFSIPLDICSYYWSDKAKIYFNDITPKDLIKFVNAEDEYNDTSKLLAIGKVVTQSTALNMRKQPSASADVITQIPKDSSVGIISSSGDWYYIKYYEDKNSPIYYGYVSKEYVTITQKLDDSSSIASSTVINGVTVYDCERYGRINTHGGTLPSISLDYITGGEWKTIRDSLGNGWHIKAVRYCYTMGITWYEIIDSDDGDYYGWIDGEFIDFNN